MKKKIKQGLVDERLLNNKNFRKEQIKVFMITMLLYCTWHASRTAWAYSKKGIKEKSSYFTDNKLGVFDMCFMISYSFGQFYNGWLGDQSNLKIFMAVGTGVSIVGYFIFASLAKTESYSMVIFMICFLLYGFGQSRGFPGNTAVLGNWIEASRRGMLLALWNACSDNIGNIIGQQIGRVIIDVSGLHWSNTIFLTGATMILMGIIMMFYLKVHPKDAHLGIEDEKGSTESPQIKLKASDGNQDADTATEMIINNVENTKGISFTEAFRTPGIIKYSLIFACIKGSIYGLLFWLPDYLHTIMGFGQVTASIAAAFEVGQFIGAIGLGYITDHLGKRSVALVTTLYISAIIFIFLAFLGPGSAAFTFGLIIFIAGVFFGGPAVIVGAVVSSDLGENASLKKDVKSVSTICGIVNGTGSVAAAIIQLIIPSFKSNSFYVYFGLCLLAAVLLTPTALKDFREKETEKYQNNFEVESEAKEDEK